MKKDELQKIDKIVRDILVKDKRARKDDFYLISVLIERVKPDFLKVSLLNALLTAKESKLPPFESITRARRKVQQREPELKDKATEIARFNETSAYIQYAIEGGGKYNGKI